MKHVQLVFDEASKVTRANPEQYLELFGKKKMNKFELSRYYAHMSPMERAQE